MYEEFAAIYDRFMGDVNYERWAALLLELFAGYRQGALRIFDVACGTGNISILFARAGHDVTASDQSEQMLAVAAQKGRDAGVRIPFVRQDLRSLSLHRKVDVMNCSCDGVNYLTDEHDVKAFFASAFALLQSGGILCFDISSRYKLEQVLAGNTFGEDEEDAAYLWRNAYDEEQRLLEMQLTMFVQSGGCFVRRRERHVQRAHDEDELVLWLEQSGFTNIRMWNLGNIESGSPSLFPPDERTERILFLAEKPRTA